MEGAGFDLHVDSSPNCGPNCSVIDFANSGTFSTALYTSCAESVIAAHDPAQGPLFLYLPYQAVHAPDEVPTRYIDPYNATIPSVKRRTFAGMLSALDEGVGNVTAALEAQGLLDNTIIFFTADNGGPIECPENICGDSTGATNFPLRGGKHSLWEGGVRLTSAVWAPPGVLASPGTNRTGLMHLTDVLPTLLDAAGVTVPPSSHLPWHGSSQWDMVSTGAASTRTEVLLNIDPLQPQGLGNGNAALRSGDWKLMVGEVGPPWSYMPQAVGPVPYALLYGGGIGGAYDDGAVGAGEPTIAPYPGNWPLTNMTVQLYNLADDERETTDVSASNPTVVQELMARLVYWATEVQVRPLFYNATVDPRSNPKNPGRQGAWYPWLP
jgi:arylsulfatase B